MLAQNADGGFLVLGSSHTTICWVLTQGSQLSFPRKMMLSLPGPEAPADSRGRVSSRRPAELEKPVRLLRKAITTDPPLCGPRRCSEGGAWQAARGGSQPQVERRARQTSPNAGGDQSGKVLWVPLPATFRGGAREGISHLRTSSGFGNCFPIATCAGQGHSR